MKNEKILVICASGVGNTILFTPTLKTIRRARPKAKITLFVASPIFAEPVKGIRLADEIIVFDYGKSFLEKIKLILKLRNGKFDYSVTAFPSNRWQFNVFAFLAGAKKRITHSYRVGGIKTLSFLQNVKVSVNENLHDVDQNLNLLKPLKISLPEEKRLLFYLSEKEKDAAEKFWRENNLNGSFVAGIHPGSGGIEQEAKRWPVEKFIKLCNRLIKEKKAKILIFGGQDEKKLKSRINNSTIKSQSFVINGSLKLAAALIQKCNLFIANDSGLMHIAVAMRVKTIGIFGPTNYKRTAPYGKNCYIVRGKFSCPSCLTYPFYSTSSAIKCKESIKCLKEIKVNEVMDKYEMPAL